MTPRTMRTLVLAAGVAVGVWLCCYPGRRAAEVPSEVSKVTPEAVASAPVRMEPLADRSDPVADNPLPLPIESSPQPIVETLRENLTPQEEAEGIAVEPAEQLLQLIPDWLHECGDVRRERIQLAGHWVDRVRGRYEWPNGSQVEVEVADLGAKVSEEQFKSLGFDFDLNPGEDEQGIRLIDNGEDSFFNLEYDSEDAAGSVQYIVAARYLMEVKIQKLPLECFQVMEDRDGLLAALHRYMLEQGAPPMSGKK